MGDEQHACGICIDRPRAVRNLPRGHGGLCEMCTIERLGSAAIMHSLKSSPSSGGAASQLRAVTSSEAGSRVSPRGEAGDRS